MLLDVEEHDGRAVNVVHGNAENPDLVGVEIDGQHAIDAHRGQHVRNDLRQTALADRTRRSCRIPK